MEPYTTRSIDSVVTTVEECLSRWELRPCLHKLYHTIHNNSTTVYVGWPGTFINVTQFHMHSNIHTQSEGHISCCRRSWSQAYKETDTVELCAIYSSSSELLVLEYICIAYIRTYMYTLHIISMSTIAIMTAQILLAVFSLMLAVMQLTGMQCNHPC